jgi:hypothetical protein
VFSDRKVDDVEVGAKNMTSESGGDRSKDPLLDRDFKHQHMVRCELNPSGRKDPSVLNVPIVVIFWTRNLWPSRKRTNPTPHPALHGMKASSLLQVGDLFFPTVTSAPAYSEAGFPFLLSKDFFFLAE